MSAPYVSPIGEIVWDDMTDTDCIDEPIYHMAVAPRECLAMQARIARAVAPLTRPISRSAFYAAAMLSEDVFLGTIAWPEQHELTWLRKARAMWAAVEERQRVERSLRLS